jgi:hypothetical protein
MGKSQFPIHPIRKMKLTLKKFLVIISLPLLLLTSNHNAICQEKGPLLNDTVHFMVNMSYMIQNGTFDPVTDSIDITGTMNDWGGNVLHRIGKSDTYGITFLLPIASVQSYRFRICSSDTVQETVDAMSRYVRILDTTMTVTNYFNNFNPATVAMTFNCDLYYQIKAGHFSPAVDYLDVAGNFNNGGANDVLFPKYEDSLYSLTMFFDTAMIGGDPLLFRFRFNGNWETAELSADSNRTFTLKAEDNSFDCWYNNIDPTVPSLPFVYNVYIGDSLYYLKNITGRYTYEDYNLMPEGISLYQWYTADSIGGALTPIDSAWHVVYKVDSLYHGKYLAFEVTPVTVDSVAGLSVLAWSSMPVMGVGIPENSAILAHLYPNPAIDMLTIEFLKPVRNLELFDMTGKTVFHKSVDPRTTNIGISVRDFDPGIYFLIITDQSNRNWLYRVIKR